MIDDTLMGDTPNPTALDYCSLATLSLMQGVAFTFMKIGVQTLTAFDVVYLRVLFAALIIMVYFLYRFGEFRRYLSRYWAQLLVLSVSSIILPFSLIAWSETKLPSGIPSIYMALIPIFVAVFGSIAGVENALNLRGYLGLLLGFLGVSALSFRDVVVVGISGVLPNVACFASAACYAFSIIRTRQIPDVPPRVISVTVMIFSCLILTPIFIASAPFGIEPSQDSLIAVLLLSIISTVGALVVLYFLINKIGGTFTAMANYLIPIMGLLWGYVILGERIPITTVPCVAAVLLGLRLVRGRRTSPLSVKQPSK